jgi:deoxycytidine triphosphate deaminase
LSPDGRSMPTRFSRRASICGLAPRPIACAPASCRALVQGRRQARTAEAARDRSARARCWKPVASTSCRCWKALALPGQIAASANPKSSTGRLDIFTRVMTDHGVEFDKIAGRLSGPLWLEVSPRTFPIVVRTGSRLSQSASAQGPTLCSTRMMLCGSACRRDAGRRRRSDHRACGIACRRSVGRGGRPRRLSRQAPHGGYRCRQARRPGSARFLGAAAQSRLRKELILDPDEFYILVSARPSMCRRSMPPR